MDTDNYLIYFSLIIGVAVFLFEVGMLRSFYSDEANRNKKLKNRLNDLKTSYKSKDSLSIIKGEFDNNSKINRYYPFYEFINKMVVQAGADTTVKMVYLQITAATITGLVAGFNYSKDYLISVACALAAASVPLLILLQKKNKRVQKFEDQFGDGVDIIIRALKAGHPFDSSLNLVAQELPSPISDEFAITYAEINYGMPLPVALKNLMFRMPSESLKSFVTSVLIQKETGGNLAEIMEKISAVIRNSQKFQRRLRTLSAEGRISAWVLAALPLFMAVYYTLTQPEVMVYLYDYQAGQNLLKLSFCMYVIGFLWVKKVIKLEP